ncbi:hypothetical protein LBMAG56_10850 [Verrucomicrobiota bacterium]|nr:hypothetical protein LBMAG56_10850 [Verrucomicrobiota bacterium]
MTKMFCLPLLTGSLLAGLLTSPTIAVHAANALPPDARVAIIGDSITEQKLYSKFMEAYLVASTGRRDIKVFQFGWGGETAGGFAGRLENDLAAFQPTVATTCYGMNDGGYRPFDEGVGKNYENNMRTVVKKLAAVGVKHIVVGSPGAVDTKFFGARTSFPPGKSADGYNHSLAQLGVIGSKLAKEINQTYADVHSPMIDAMTKAKAALGESYDVCGKDGFHPGPNGHLIMAYAFLKALGVDGSIGEITVDLSGETTATGGHKVLGKSGAGVEIESSRYPFCFDADPKNSGSTRSITPFFPFNQDLNRFTLKVKNLTAAKAKVTWGKVTREFSKEQLEAGVNLAAEFPSTPFDEAFGKVLGAVANKQNF